MYKLVVGTKNWSSWSLRAWLALKATEEPFEEIVVPLRQSESAKMIRSLSPSMRIPALEIEESGAKTLVFDSLAICETLAERHPNARLWPINPQARALARSYASEMHSGFLALRESLSMDFARTLTTPELNETVYSEIDRIQDALGAALTQYGDSNGFLFGHFSIADCMYAPVVSRLKTYGIPVREDVTQYMDRVTSLPAMQIWHSEAAKEIENGLPDQWVVDMVRNAR